MCNYGSGEVARFQRVEKPKARKEHICCECGATIEKGEVYEKITGMWCDEFEEYKTCLFCSEARYVAWKEFDLNSDEGFVFGELWECVGMDFMSKKESENEL